MNIEVMRALSVIARLIDPTVGREIEAVTTFVAETATAVGVYFATAAGGVPGLVVGITMAVVHLIANLTAGEDPSVTLLREFRAAIREVYDRFNRVDAKLENLSSDLFEQFNLLTALIVKEGEKRRTEAVQILNAIEKLDEKLDRRFEEFRGLIQDQRKSEIKRKVDDAVSRVLVPQEDNRNTRVADIKAAVELIRGAANQNGQ